MKTINCATCTMRSDNHCLAYAKFAQSVKREISPEPFSGCIVPIVDRYLEKIAKGHKVLEIGCGVWSPIKDHCEKFGAHYEAIDSAAVYFGEKTVATRVENLAVLSFPDDQFDFVIGNQTMEHWGEYGCATSWGLYQCFRATKPGGSVLMNVPIYFHGVAPFLMGRFDEIEKLFGRFSNHVEMDKWGSDTTPIKPFIAHPKYAPLQGKPAHILDIRAIKDKPMPKGFSNGIAATGILARLLNNPPSYVFYQAIQRGLKKI